MRRFLKILDSLKRRDKAPEAHGPAKHGRKAVGSSQTGKPKPRPQPALTDVVRERRRRRWENPELEGPEFHGLVERRETDNRGLMPEPFRPEPEPSHKARGPSKLGSDPKHVKVSSEGQDDEDTSSTGVFLSALDNSAITLADSGLFKVGEEIEERSKTSRRDGRYDPYDGD